MLKDDPSSTMLSVYVFALPNVILPVKFSFNYVPLDVLFIPLFLIIVFLQRVNVTSLNLWLL